MNDFWALKQPVLSSSSEILHMLLLFLKQPSLSFFGWHYCSIKSQFRQCFPWAALPVSSTCTPVVSLLCWLQPPVPPSTEPPTLQWLATPATQPHRGRGPTRQTSRAQDSTYFVTFAQGASRTELRNNENNSTSDAFFCRYLGLRIPPLTQNHRLCDLEVSEENEMGNSLQWPQDGAVTGTWDQQGWHWKVLEKSITLCRRQTGGPVPDTVTPHLRLWVNPKNKETSWPGSPQLGWNLMQDSRLVEIKSKKVIVTVILIILIIAATIFEWLKCARHRTKPWLCFIS